MPLTLINSQGKESSLASPQDFQSLLGIRYLPHLEMADKRVEKRVYGRVERALKKGWIDAEQRWRGVYFAKEIRKGVALDLTIRWIDGTLGYGLWTNRAIPAQSCVGEYTGILRKRSFFKKWDNHYCFLYPIGEGRRVKYMIDAEGGGNYTRFVNHQENGNLESASVYCDGLVHIVLLAPKEIPAGVQLCYDYGSDYWKKRGLPQGLSPRS